MKKKYKNSVVSECSLFLKTKNCFIGASPDHLLTCDCCENARVEIKFLFIISFQKPYEQNLDYKSYNGIKVKTNHSNFT